MGYTKVNDTEVYKRYCLIGFKDVETGKISSCEAVDGAFSREDRDWMKRMMKRYQIITFNGNGFDLPIIYGAIAGLTTLQLKRMANSIIVDGLRSWEIESAFNIKIPRNLDHIDLIEVAPGMASLKIYNGRIHGRRMQDLPIEPDADLTDEDIEVIYDYWENDLDATVGLYKALKTQIDLRTAMTKEYGVDLRSKSDAQVAEAVIKAEITKILGEVPKRPSFKGGQGYRYNIPTFLKYETKQLNDLLDDVRNSWFRLADSGKILMPKSLGDRKIVIGETTYRMGIGGLHSSEETAGYRSDDESILLDRDVESYYPRIIINQKLFPKQLGMAFLKVYEGIVNRRIKAKNEEKRLKGEIAELEKQIAQANGPTDLMTERLVGLTADKDKWHIINEGLKITINGSFGKLGSPWSILFAPDLMIQTTVTGQLSLLMLIERLEGRGIPVVSGNTDGIVIRCPRAKRDLCNEIIAQWEKETAFKTEEAVYKALYSRDVNNYFALKEDGSAKRKGAFAKAGLLEKKNPSIEICADAVAAYMTKGTPMSQTIKGCKDIRKFITVRTVKGGATKDGRYLGKAIRWYQSSATASAIHYKNANATGTHNKVPKSDGGMPIMELPDEFPTDVDYSWYIRECRSILKDVAYEEDLIGKPVRKKRVVLEAA
jgi:hypothetical protein